MHFRTVLAAIFVLGSVIGCGGTDDPYVEYSKFNAADDGALQGDWHATEFVVTNAADWNRHWELRSAMLNCSLPHNAKACAASGPPSVDFSGNTVVGMTYGYRVGPMKHALRVRDVGDLRSLVVEYAFFISGTLFYSAYPPSAEFIIVPRANATVTFEYAE